MSFKSLVEGVRSIGKAMSTFSLFPNPNSFEPDTHEAFRKRLEVIRERNKLYRHRFYIKMTWVSMDEAPMDGTHILLRVKHEGHWYAFVGYYEDIRNKWIIPAYPKNDATVSAKKLHGWHPIPCMDMS